MSPRLQRALNTAGRTEEAATAAWREDEPPALRLDGSRGRYLVRPVPVTRHQAGCVAKSDLGTEPHQVLSLLEARRACGPLEVVDILVRLCHDLPIDEGGFVGITGFWSLRRPVSGGGGIPATRRIGFAARLYAKRLRVACRARSWARSV